MSLRTVVIAAPLGDGTEPVGRIRPFRAAVMAVYGLLRRNIAKLPELVRKQLNQGLLTKPTDLITASATAPAAWRCWRNAPRLVARNKTHLLALSTPPRC